MLEHEGARMFWLALEDAKAFVFDVETGAAHRGRATGLRCVLAERQASHDGVQASTCSRATPAALRVTRLRDGNPFPEQAPVWTTQGLPRCR
ncbi:hypothetical protein SCANM63S_09842 [Streptomyces canarius]